LGKGKTYQICCKNPAAFIVFANPSCSMSQTS